MCFSSVFVRLTDVIAPPPPPSIYFENVRSFLGALITSESVHHVGRRIAKTHADSSFGVRSNDLRRNRYCRLCSDGFSKHGPSFSVCWKFKNSNQSFIYNKYYSFRPTFNGTRFEQAALRANLTCCIRYRAINTISYGRTTVISDNSSFISIRSVRLISVGDERLCWRFEVVCAPPAVCSSAYLGIHWDATFWRDKSSWRCRFDITKSASSGIDLKAMCDFRASDIVI